MSAVTLQINLAPPDARYARHVLPHQLRAWGGQVSEILLTLEVTRSRGAQFGTGWDQQLSEIHEILAAACSISPIARVIEVDYSKASRQAVADSFFGGKRVPEKDFRGGPYYSYFFGLQQSTENAILHVDADMMFGGLSQTWLAEALELLRSEQSALCINPFPGPPSPTGRMPESEHYGPEKVADGVYRFSRVSTRLFLVDRERFRARLGPLPAERVPGMRMRLGAARARRTTHALPEDVISRQMTSAGMCRLDLLGATPGMWAVHPVVRDEAYYDRLPDLLNRIERGDISRDQEGHYNLQNSMLTLS